MAVVKDKKDVSVLLETQLPEFINDEYPKFKKFIEKYYEFMESHQLYFGTSFTFNDDKIVNEEDGTSYFQFEDPRDTPIISYGARIQIESDRDTASNANLMFTLGETLTGDTSGATAVVSGTKGNTIAFVKSSSIAGFRYGEKLTGSITGSYGTLANGIVDGVFPTGSIESFRSKAPAAALRELSDSQDIDTTCEGLIDDAWKKEFYTNLPKTAVTDRRQLLKRMKQVYRSKGNEASFSWLFQSLFNKEDIEFYYPKTDLLKLSDGRWALDKSIKIVTSGANNITLFTGRKITGELSKCTAMVERQLSSFAGALEVTELTLSDVVQGVVDGVLFYFKPGEKIISETDTDGLYADAVTTGILQTVTVDVGGTNYVIGDEIHVAGGGGQGARARVASILDSVVEGINVIDSGDGYAPGDVIGFINDGTGGSGAAGHIQTIISTGAILRNTDLISMFAAKQIAATDYASTFIGHNANTALFSNSSLTFSAGIKSLSAKLYDNQGNYDATTHILAGDRIAKQVSVNTSGVTLTQSVKTVTLSTGISENEKIDIVGGKLTYANANTNIITGFSSNTVLTVRDTHTIGSGQTFSVDYASNTYWGTIISANTTAFLYSVGSYYRDNDIDGLTVQNFVNDDNIIVYDSQFTKLGIAAAGSGIDSHLIHNGVTFQAGNTPAAVTTNTFTMVDAHGASPDVVAVCNGALNMTSVNIGAIDTFVLTSGGGKYETSPPVSIANNYTPTLGNALDVVGAPNALLNVNLHSFHAGTIAQDGNVVTLTSEESFPDANSGLLTITYANGATDKITAVTNTTVIRVATEKVFGYGTGDFPDKETYSLSYMALANNITKNTLLYNDDYSARGRVLDFIDHNTLPAANPYIANGNTTLRMDMTTAQDFGGVIEHILLEEKDFHNDRYSHERLLLESATLGSAQGGGGIFLVETSVEFLAQENGTTNTVPADAVLAEDGTRFYTEATAGDRITAHSNSVSTYAVGTIAQSGTTVTGVGTVFPNDFVRGTITYSGDDDTTSIITGYTNATSFTVEDSKTVASGNTYSISYNPVLTWGINREITLAASGTGNRTATVTEAAHYLRTGDKVKITGSGTGIFNGIFPITVANNTTYTYTLPEDTGVTSPAGEIRSRPVSSLWLATSNAVTMDTSPKGNNAVIEVSAIAIGAIQSAEVYDFGAGYSSVPNLSTTSGDQNAELTAGLGAYATYPGYYTATTGLLSGVPKIQDNKYYQQFSYVLKTDFDVNDYRNSVKRLTHPSGLIMFGELAIRSQVSVEMFDAAERNVDSTRADGARKYHNITLFGNTALINVQFQSYATANELEIYTANHPWQAMNARLETYDEVNLQLENYVEISSIARTNSTMYVVTETLHGLETGDTVEFSGDESAQEFNRNYSVTSAPTTNTYTISPTTDYGSLNVPGQSMYDGFLYIQLEDQQSGNNVIMEDASDLMMEAEGYLKSKVIAYSDVFRAERTNWDSPFSGVVLNEDSTEILLERGGSYLYPSIQFPEGETGVISIDMSFNSDILLEDDNGAYGYGYLLDETSAGQGNGPQRFISLEEDTQGPDHQYESIPIVDTHVIETWYNSIRQHLISESGLDRVMFEDGELLTLDTVPITKDPFELDFELPRIYNAIVGEDGEYIIEEDSTTGNNHIMVEDYYGLRQNKLTEVQFDLLGDIQIESTTSTPEVQFDLYDTTGWHFLAEDGFTHLRYEDGTRPVTEESHVKDLTVGIEKTYQVRSGQHTLMEDGYHYLYEDESFPLMEEGWFKYPTGEIEFNLIDSMRGGFQTEDGFDFIAGEGEEVLATKLISERPPFERTPVIIHDPLISPTGRIRYEDFESLADAFGGGSTVTPVEPMDIAFEDSTPNVKSFLIEEGKFAHKQRMAGPGGKLGDTAFRIRPPVAGTGQHTIMEDGYHLTLEESILDTTIVIYIVTVAQVGLNNYFHIDGVDRATLALAGDRVYRFDLSAGSNLGHEFRFSLTSNGHHAGGTAYTTDVTIVGTAGSAGAYVELRAPNTLQVPLYYHCHAHSDMGGTANITQFTYLGLNSRLSLEEGWFKSPTGEIEYNLLDSVGHHLKFEDEDHIIEEGDETAIQLSRFILDDSPFKQLDITKHYVTEEAPSDLQRWTPANHELDSIQTWKDTVVTRTYGMQLFRPHYVSNWADANLSFVDDKFTQEDDTGLIILEHPVTNQDYLLHEDFPELLQDVLNLQREELDGVLLEDELQTRGAIDGRPYDYLQQNQYETYTVTVFNTGSGEIFCIDSASYGVENAHLDFERFRTVRFDVSDASMWEHGFRLSTTIDGPHGGGTELITGAGRRIVGGQNHTHGSHTFIAGGVAGAYVEYTIDGTVEGTIGGTDTIAYYCIPHAGMGGKITLLDKTGSDRVLMETANPVEEGFGPAFTPSQAYAVLPAYRYSRILTRMKGTISFSHMGTTGTGSDSEFTAQLSVGEEFQTLDENLIDEDSGGGILLETDERIEAEEIRIFHVQTEDLAQDLLGTQIRNFRWLITTEDTTVPAHGSHAGVTGEYSAFDTSLESFWITTDATNQALVVGLDHEVGVLERETPDWENINMLWEDGSKQVVIDAQAFIVSSITNDALLEVTRKHIGGTDNVTYQL